MKLLPGNVGLALLCIASSVQAAGEPPRTPKLVFDEQRSESNFEFVFSAPDEPYLLKLRSRFRLDVVVADATTDLGRLKAINAWVHQQFRHDGQNEPTGTDPLSILEEAATGEDFRCVEYASVVSGCLNAIGIPSRIVELKTRGCERSTGGAGHVLAEAYLRDLEKWALVDPQWDVIVMEDEVPLNLVELQRALSAAGADVRVVSDNPDADMWLDWIAQFLFYLDVRFDQRVTAEGLKWERPRLMLVPIGAKKPTLFQKHPLPNVSYTHSSADFYEPPKIMTADEK